MRASQLRNIESKYRSSVKEIEDQGKVSVSYSLELAGVARILAKPKKEPFIEEPSKLVTETYDVPETTVEEFEIVPAQVAAEVIVEEKASQPVVAEG